jgi:hypothetical protein
MFIHRLGDIYLYSDVHHYGWFESYKIIEEVEEFMKKYNGEKIFKNKKYLAGILYKTLPKYAEKEFFSFHGRQYGRAQIFAIKSNEQLSLLESSRMEQRYLWMEWNTYLTCKSFFYGQNRYVCAVGIVFLYKKENDWKALVVKDKDNGNIKYSIPGGYCIMRADPKKHDDITDMNPDDTIARECEEEVGLCKVCVKSLIKQRNTVKKFCAWDKYQIKLGEKVIRAGAITYLVIVPDSVSIIDIDMIKKHIDEKCGNVEEFLKGKKKYYKECEAEEVSASFLLNETKKFNRNIQDSIALLRDNIKSSIDMSGEVRSSNLERLVEENPFFINWV